MRPFEPTESELRARPGIKWHQYPDDVLPAWIAEMDFDIPAPIHSALRHVTDEGAYGYEDANLYPALGAEFREYMQRRYAWQPDVELVLPMADLVQALYVAVGAFSERGERVILHTPIYPPFINAVQEMGRHVLEHPLIDDGRRFTLDGDGLSGLIASDTPLIMLCNPHNPSGRVFERSELEAIAAVAVERQLVVVADEVHADLAYDGRRHIPFASLDPRVAERTVTLSSATKAYNIPGLRCGLMHFGSRALRERFRVQVPDRMLGRVNRFGIEASIVAWQQCEDWLAAVMQRLHPNRDRLVHFVAEHLPGVRCYAPEATYLAWLDCRALDLPTSPRQFFLEKARVALSDGADFGRPGGGHARMNFATSESILQELLRRMAGAVADR
jgi:cystathionine beta-lyase